ncbi:DNA helicase-2/ATP-dependent DNA helicase PcrA [Rhodopirellula rubra]|uniref:DNA 3'-5' helicase II n=1 Tax=Aporhodopirellula rubra TaxID=980271 RepID=A0A7W5DVM5_9BACT|nr:UvrD-helicase domain-containing protein [Aporhodopirellula rubra]MBB3204913.1 DNA helicase-2/ATP-dependent DNA helicase PcrA [Aporhodopirellula rubra]
MKPTLVVAGPGAGKTHEMVDQIEKAIQELTPCRHLAAITYTNAATNEIRERLARRVHLPRNVFIGTTHTFVSRFILRPFATLMNELPEQRIYVAFQNDKPPMVRNSIKKKMRAKGIVPYEDMLATAVTLLSNPKIRARIGGRLQFLFIDEFQDVDKRQLKVFDQLRIEKQTRIYVVGDPEQYITSHAYAGTNMKAPTFEELPFNEFKSKSRLQERLVNHRANGELVEFTNQFRTDIQQDAHKPKRGVPAVFCCNSHRVQDMVLQFRDVCQSISSQEKVEQRLYLSRQNDCFDPVRVEFGIRHSAGNGKKTKTLLGDASELLSQAAGASPREVQAKCLFDNLTWRKHCLSILQLCREGSLDEAAVWTYAKRQLGLDRKSSTRNLSSLVFSLNAAVAIGTREESTELSSSIHRAKGLQADGVLAVARTQNELLRWLETDPKERTRNKSDDCRIGYVAATRARELLCYGCMEPIGSDAKKQIGSLGIVDC